MAAELVPTDVEGDWGETFAATAGGSDLMSASAAAGLVDLAALIETGVCFAFVVDALTVAGPAGDAAGGTGMGLNLRATSGRSSGSIGPPPV